MKHSLWLLLACCAAVRAESLIEHPAAAGSSAPHLATLPDGEVLSSWIEPDGEHGHALKFAILSSGAWTEPHLVAAGANWIVNPFDFGFVAPVAEGTLAAQWLEGDAAGGYGVRISLSDDGGRTWSDAVTPHRDGTATEHGFAALFSWRERVGVVWIDGRDYAAEIDYDAPGALDIVVGSGLRVSTLDRHGAPGADEVIDPLVCDCCRIEVATVPAGLVLAYRDRTEDEIRDTAVRRRLAGHWSEPLMLGEEHWQIDACPINGPAVAAHGRTVAVAWFTGAGGERRVRLARSSDEGTTFDDPIDVAAGDALGHVDVAQTEGDETIVSWLAAERGAANGELRARVIRAGGNMGAAHRIAELASVSAGGYPQLAWTGREAVFAWTDRSGEAQRIRSVAFTLEELDETRPPDPR
jgi:hypothetical protein